MKKTILTFLSSLMLMVFVNQAYAQVPQGFNYQAVARNSVGVLITNQTLGVMISIHQSTSTGTIVYSESHTPTTNQFGLFTITVGQGTFIGGSPFNTILWSSGNFWMEVGLDVSGGTTYTSMGASQLLTVPYAMYAGSTDSSLPTASSGQTLRHDGSNWVANSLLYNDGNNIGIGTAIPSTQLHTTGTIKFEGAGTPGNGKVLTSDATGNATWQDIPVQVVPGTIADISYAEDDCAQPTAINTYEWAGPLATLTITSVTQKVILMARVPLGSTIAATGLRIYPAYSLTSASTPTTWGDGTWDLQCAINTRQIYTTSAVITGLTPGIYYFGAALFVSALDWNLSEIGSVTATLVN